MTITPQGNELEK